MSGQVTDLQIFDKQCYTIEDKPLGLIPVRNVKWRNGDVETLRILAQEYHFCIRKEMIELRQINLIHGSGMVQAGGNSGLYPVLFTEFFNPVITFEPNPINFHCLVNNCQIPNVIKFNAALGAKNGKIKSVELFWSNSGMSKVEEVDSSDYIPMTTIDAFEFTDIGMIQLDVEGYEFEVLKGAMQTIKNNRPVLMIETDNPEKVSKILSKYQYTLYKELENQIDFIYVPKERL
jgi:FkbM family methyltransferase